MLLQFHNVISNKWRSDSRKKIKLCSPLASCLLVILQVWSSCEEWCSCWLSWWSHPAVAQHALTCNIDNVQHYKSLYCMGDGTVNTLTLTQIVWLYYSPYFAILLLIASTFSFSSGVNTSSISSSITTPFFSSACCRSCCSNLSRRRLQSWYIILWYSQVVQLRNHWPQGLRVLSKTDSSTLTCYHWFP